MNDQNESLIGGPISGNPLGIGGDDESDRHTTGSFEVGGPNDCNCETISLAVGSGEIAGYKVQILHCDTCKHVYGIVTDAISD